MADAKIVASRALYAGKFLGLDEITYLDEEQCERRWESAVRMRHTPAVMILPVIRPVGEVVIVRQFRPPTGRYVWETPAGLIEPGEAVADAALRELYEETGFQAKIRTIMPESFSSSGLSGESVHMVFVDIDEARYPHGTLPAAHPDPGEHIEVHRVKWTDLRTHLLQALAAGDAVDSKLLLYSEMCNSANV